MTTRATVEELNRDFMRYCKQQTQSPGTTQVPEKEVSSSDPRIYLEVVESSAPLFPRTPFVLHNRGGDVAHNVQIDSFTLNKHTVTFESVGVIAPEDKRDILPSIEEAGALTHHNILHWLTADWNAAGKPVAEWPVSVRVTYENFAKRKFETRLELLCFPIKAIHQQNRPAWPQDNSPILMTRNFEFRKVS
jgi:hypothetical protein